MLAIRQKLSLYTLVGICVILSVYRINTVDKREISWDIFGYYLPLPASFIHHDPLLKDTSWITAANDKYELSDTLYQLSSNDQGEPIYVFLFGMALLYLPFFLLGHGAAHLFGFETDGFSMPYQYAMVLGGILYTIIGLIYLRKILLRFFSEEIASLVLLLLVFGTNYIHHLTVKNLETVTVLFMFMTIIVWNSIRFSEEQKPRNLFAMAVSVTMAVLVKPSEVFVFIVPLFWGVDSFVSFRKKIASFFSNKKALFLSLLVCFLLVVPQLAYWHTRTGHYVYDSYKNPGVGLDITSPHIWNVLFSYRKGWFVYTPLMLFAFWGAYFVYKEQRRIFWSILLYFIVAFYIICCWSYWFYGAAFSCRPVITAYPLLGICLGYFLVFALRKGRVFKIVIALLFAFFVFLNQFQWWQLKNYILDPYRTTKAYYWATFLKTSASEADRELLLVNRDFSGKMIFDHPEKYTRSTLLQLDFSKENGPNYIRDSSGTSFFRVLPEQEFCLSQEFVFKELTSKDHAWIHASFDIRYDTAFSGPLPSYVITMDYKGGVYGYFASELKSGVAAGSWQHQDFDYLTPEPRTLNDHLKSYFWKTGKQGFDIRNFVLTIDQPKD